LDKQELGQKLVEINTSIAALSDFTEQFFGWAVSQRKDFKVNKVWFDLQLLFDETADLYEDLVKINNNTLKIIPGNYQVYTDRNILSVIIRNLLDNANKNTNDGEILLYASYTLEHLVITVSDTGKGLREAQLDAFTAKEGNSSETGSGSGYGSMIIRNLLEKIGGVLKIDTELDTGARFQVWLDYSSVSAIHENTPSGSEAR
jgi:signal transduction histidine kinase